MASSGTIKKNFKFPSTPTLLVCVILFAAFLTYVIPAGEFERVVDEATKRTLVVAGTFKIAASRPVGFMFLTSAIYRGIVSAAQLIAFVFVCGGTFGVINKTGAITASLNNLIKKFKGRENLLVFVIMLAFATGGMSYGMAEEAIPFIAILVPVAIKMGFDPVVGVAMVITAIYSGYSPGPLNPFNTGIAQGIAQLPTFSGLGLRLVLAVAALLVSFQHIVAYGKKYRLSGKKEDFSRWQNDSSEERAMTGRDSVVLSVLVACLLVLVYGVLVHDWYLAEMSAIFTICGFVVGLYYFKGSLESTMTAFVAGAKDLAGTALIVSLSRAILVVMQEGMIMDTLVYWISMPLSTLHPVFAAWGMYLSQGFVNFFIPSSSGQAVAVMPIMSALADLIGITRQTAVLAFQCGDGFWNMITPTHATLMACIGIAGISFDRWFRFAIVLVLKWSALVLVALAFAVLTGYGPF